MTALRRVWLAVLLALAGCPGVESGSASVPDAASDAPSTLPAPVPSIDPVAEAEARAAALARARAAAAEARSAAERAAEEAARAAAEAEARAREEAERAAFEAAYPLNGVVYHFLGQVRAAPDAASLVVGYMRRGAQFRAKPAVRGPGCTRGWHEVPGGGFVCSGGGFQIGASEQTFEPSPAPPALDDALPYPYAWTARDDVPQYWRIPTPGEEREAASVIDRIEEAEARAASRPAPAPAAEAATSEIGASEEAVEAPPPPGQVADPGTAAPAQEDGVTLPSFFRMRMLRGFYVSLDREEIASDGVRRFFRTVRGAYVPADALSPNEPPAMRGVVLGGEWSLPIAIVYRGGAHRLRRDPATGALHDEGTIERHTPLVVADTLQRGGTTYVVSRRGAIVRSSAVRRIDPAPRPARVPQGARWIHVKLSEQTLVAYEGDTPVFATLVSTGKEGYETPAGLFRIQSKHVSTTMDDLHSPDGAYSIEDVPWTMYFEGNFALHGAFWHEGFGRVRSHGCVNLAPADARWLFQWTTPTLPIAWHGIYAAVPGGTFVVIEE